MKNKIEKISLIAKNYADALIAIGQEGKLSFDKILEDLQTVTDAYSASKDLQSVLANPSFNDEIKTDVLTSVFEGKISKEILNFLLVLIQRKRINELSGIYSDFKNKLNSIKNVQAVEILSAVELSDEQKRKIVECLSNKLSKLVVPNWGIDGDLIAGITVKVNDDVIDMSLKSRIEKLSKSLMLD